MDLKQLANHVIITVSMETRVDDGFAVRVDVGVSGPQLNVRSRKQTH